MVWQEAKLAYQTHWVLVEAISHEGGSGAKPAGASSGPGNVSRHAGSKLVVEGGTFGNMFTVEDAACMALDLPEVTESERHGNRTWSVAGKVFAWERPFSKADIRRFGDEQPPHGPILAVRVMDLDHKEAVLAKHLKTFFTIPHFDGYAAVLIQLKTVSRRALEDAIFDGWLACSPAHLADEYFER